MFYDRPMGTGKTRDLLNGFDKETRYLVVHEFLEQCDDIINNPAEVPFVQPEATQGQTKGQHLETLIRQGKNVVTTHSLYPSIVGLVREGLLDEYVIIIDETPDPLETPQGPLKGTWLALVKDGYAEVSEYGKVIPLANWEANSNDVRDSLKPKLFDAAKAGILYVTGESHWFIIPIPVELLMAGNSITIMTFMAEGSVLAAYLDRVGIPYVIDRDVLAETQLRSEIRSLVKLKDIPALKKNSFSVSGQTTKSGRREYVKRVQVSLANIRQRQLSSVPVEDILVGCIKSNWYYQSHSAYDHARPNGFSKNSRLFGAKWAPASVRGLNTFRNCSVVVSLYDYHLNPGILEWLDKRGDRKFKDRYALSELLQFIYRSRIRCRSAIDDSSITLFMPCKRMRDILLTWVNQDALPEDCLRVTR